MKLEVSNIRAGYGGGADVLKDVSVTVQKGTVVGLIGANGAGKSTLLRTICGFLKPRAGDVVLDDRTATGLRPDSLAARGIGYLMEGHSVFPSLTVEENLQLGTWSFRNDRDRVKRVTRRAFERAPILEEKRSIKAGLLSGGQQRILELQRLSLGDPSLIILDEPSLGLAPKLVQEVFDIVSGLRSSGAAILLVDQSARHVAAAADHLYVLRLGQIQMQGPAIEYRHRIEDIVREFI